MASGYYDSGPRTPLSPIAHRLVAAHRGLATMIAPRKDIVKGDEARVPPEHQAMVNRINKALASRNKFKLQMMAVWQRKVGFRSADLGGFRRWCQAIEDRLGLPIESFGNLEQAFYLYDFSGDGSLQFGEAYKLLRFALEQHRKELGGHPVLRVPEKTPEQAGYTVVRVLGVGGQGTAKLAENSEGDEVVLKVYDKTVTNAVGINDLKEEMELLQKGGNHPHIACCHEIFQDHKHLYMVGDAYMGGDFDSIQERALKHDVELDEDWYKHIFWQAFSGIKYLHSRSIVHCDIKEPNLMVHYEDYERPHVVIIDLGLATASLLGGPGAKGTPGYMPPETWEYGVWYPCGDVFSMGVVCFQMLTGRIPNAKTKTMGVFQQGRNLQEVASCTRHLEPPWHDIPEDFEDIMEWLPYCLEKSVGDRMRVRHVLDSDWFAVQRAQFEGSCPHCTMS
eukprot:TRINITY_DN10885_c0_g1_i1.p1 TRINITY_DN10885_c0_g1~~TRINITY_DN10885_c0_g1_i1.p1  ORF type:complete len:449 (+),score=105.51 TRINITY_DN10885_c0_g1_i1:387-1733(+)